MVRKRMGFDELSALVQRGDLRQAKGDTIGALHDYDAALREAPDDPMLWNNRGVSLSSLGRYDEAMGSYRKAIEIRPGYWMAWYNLGKAVHRKADRMGLAAGHEGGADGRVPPEVLVPERADAYKEAIMAYDRAHELNPSHTSTLNNKAVALRKLQRYEEALEVYDVLLGMDPMYGHAWYNKGLLLRLLGLPEEADRCFEAASGLDPEFASLGGREARPSGDRPRRLRSRRPAKEPPAIENGKESTDLRDVERPKRPIKR